MTCVIGWVRRDEPMPRLSEMRFHPEDGYIEIHATAPLASELDRLRMVQKCYRNHPTFVPHLPKVKADGSAEIVKVLERFAGLGQLRLSVKRASDAPASEVLSGRAYLKSLVTGMQKTEHWRESILASVEVIAGALPVRDQRITLTDNLLALDLLLPSSFEPKLERALTDALRKAMVAGQVSASGLWAPIAFVDKGGGRNA